MALLGALYEDDVRAVYVRGGLSDFASVLESPFCFVPHDVVVPGVLTVGDLCDVAAALAPRAVCLEGMVDGLNRIVPDAELAGRYEPARTAFAAAGATDRLGLGGAPAATADIRRLAAQLLGK